MEIKTKYDIRDKVKILPLGLEGTITKVLYGNLLETEYEVRYFKDSDLVSNYFLEDELQLKSSDNSFALS